MAVRKLPPSLFSAKARAPRSGCATPYLYFIASVRQEKNQSALVCEDQTRGFTRNLEQVGGLLAEERL